MPILPLSTPGLHYFLISFNARGEEQPEADGKPLMSEQLAARLARRSRPITDVFVVCHGWNTTAAGAHNSYVRWMGSMADDSADIRRVVAARGRSKHGNEFNPLLIGVQWPSKFMDMGGATLPADVVATALDTASPVTGTGGGGADAMARAVDAQADVLAEALDGDDASRLRANPTTAAALATLAKSMVDPSASSRVVAAASIAAKAKAAEGEASAGGGVDGGGGGGGRVAAAVATLDSPTPQAPAGKDDAALPADALDALAAVGAALEPFSDDEDGGVTGGIEDSALASSAFRLEAATAAAEGSPLVSPSGSHSAAGILAAPVSQGTLFAPLRLLMRPMSDVVFAAFQRRAAHLGRTAVHDLVAKLMTAAGVERARSGVVKFHGVGHSLGAHMVCCTALGPRRRASSLPARFHSLTLVQAAVPTTAFRPGGSYRRVVEIDDPHRPVAGSVALTYSHSDRALANYTLMYGPPLGSVGADKDLSPRIPARHAVMTDAQQSYGLAPGALLSVDSAAFVDDVDGGILDVVGSHMDITDDPVSHLVWEGVLTDVPSTAYAAEKRSPAPQANGGGNRDSGGGGWGLGRAVGGAAAASGNAVVGAGRAVGGVVGGASRLVGNAVGGGVAAVGSVAGASWSALRWALPPY
ncbi:hypothetical protein MMPV_001468 [Pyropia vietnamensis]